MRLHGGILAAVGLALVGAAGCNGTQSGLTGVDLVVHYDAGATLDQIRVIGTHDGVAAFAPLAIPDPPRRLAARVESVVILLPDGLGGAAIHLRADGLSGGTVVGSAGAAVKLAARRLTRVDLTLGPPARCGDGQVSAGAEECDDGQTAAGDGCAPSCTAEPGWTCTGAPSACTTCADGGCPSDGGVDAAPEAPRDGGVDAGHDATPTCTVTCDPMRSDWCTGNQCQCGSAPPCVSGQRCVLGQCYCDAASCPDGCCAGGQCVAGTSNQACGAHGAVCIACPGGQRCSGNACVCDATSCPNGCCTSSGQCVAGTANNACGIAGETCKVCGGNKVCRGHQCRNDD